MVCLDDVVSVNAPSIDFPEFSERAPWWGGDLQTMRNRFLTDAGPLPGKPSALEFPTSDDTGDRLTAVLETPRLQARGPLIILIHGLTGCADSSYVRNSSKFHLERRRRVLRVNLRGAGSSRKSCSQYYHAGRASDVNDLVAGIDPELKRDGIFPVGYSLGGNILINFLAQVADPNMFIGAATVSAPIVPHQAAQQLMRPRNWPYHNWLLRRMKNDYLGLARQDKANQRALINGARSIYAFDNDVIAPLNGFSDADDYYAKTAGMRHLENVKTPTLLIHGDNDPWIPDKPYRELQKTHPKNIELCFTRGGGHVGFHGRGSRQAWCDLRIETFIEDRLAQY